MKEGDDIFNIGPGYAVKWKNVHSIGISQATPVTKNKEGKEEEGETRVVIQLYVWMGTDKVHQVSLYDETASTQRERDRITVDYYCEALENLGYEVSGIRDNLEIMFSLEGE